MQTSLTSIMLNSFELFELATELQLDFLEKEQNLETNEFMPSFSSGIFDFMNKPKSSPECILAVLPSGRLISKRTTSNVFCGKMLSTNLTVSSILIALSILNEKTGCSLKCLFRVLL